MEIRLALLARLNSKEAGSKTGTTSANLGLTSWMVTELWLAVCTCTQKDIKENCSKLGKYVWTSHDYHWSCVAKLNVLSVKRHSRYKELKQTFTES